MNAALCNLERVKIFVDDILIYGQGDTMENAIKDHDRKVHSLFKRLLFKFSMDGLKTKKNMTLLEKHIINSRFE